MFVSIGLLPRNPLRSFEPFSSSSIDFASAVVIGSILNATSLKTSVMIPPNPAIIIGPNCGSFCIPTISSTPPFGTIFSKRIPFTSTPFFFDKRPYMSLNVFFTSATLSSPTFTPPTSVLCKICGETTFMTNGNPNFFACFAASSAEVTRANPGTLIPYFFKMAFDDSSVITLWSVLIISSKVFFTKDIIRSIKKFFAILIFDQKFLIMAKCLYVQMLP